jgi:hypothetical protein
MICNPAATFLQVAKIERASKANERCEGSARIFDRLYRADESKHSIGTGLRLERYAMKTSPRLRFGVRSRQSRLWLLVAVTFAAEFCGEYSSKSRLRYFQAWH